MKSIELNKGVVIALMISSISAQTLNMAVYARGGGGRRGGGGWSVGREAFMRQDFDRSNSARSDFGRHMGSAGAPRAFGRSGFGGERGAARTDDVGQHQISAAADRSSHVQDFNWGKTASNVAKPTGTQTYGRSNLLAKAPVAKTGTANPTIAKAATAKYSNPKLPFGKDHPRRNEVWDRDKSLSNKIQDDKGDLNGHYKQLSREDNAIKRQEQIDARLHNGHITPGEQRRLNREENRLKKQIRADAHGRFPHSLPNQPGPKANAPKANAPSSATKSSTPMSSLPSMLSSPQLSNAPASTTGAPATAGASTTGSTSNAAPMISGLGSSTPMMSPSMFSGDDDQQAADDTSDQQNTDDSNYPTDKTTR
jgi:hypothetical protein